MNDLQKLFHYTVEYFETHSQEEKAKLVEKAYLLVYDMEDDDFIEEVLEDINDEVFMQKVQEYALFKSHLKNQIDGVNFYHI